MKKRARQQKAVVLLDISKDFDGTPLDIRIAKLDVYGFPKNNLTFVYSYLNIVKIDITCRLFK